MKMKWLFPWVLLFICSCRSNPVSDIEDSLAYGTKQEVRANYGEPQEQGVIEELPGVLSCNPEVDLTDAVSFDRYVAPRGFMGLGIYYIYVLYNGDDFVVGVYRLFMD